ncbi:NTH1 [Candida pseudojiufengensis]|uniref:NTH1 n=1 Tax=Candida pseudojiufengensis TaxID=497109 RepID=UPI0022258C1D|nr:NTH1 [Candida pseudojiufengensis]KAI5960577.1 NTH1 [Candida pseudojiufengensis]
MVKRTRATHTTSKYFVQNQEKKRIKIETVECEQISSKSTDEELEVSSKVQIEKTEIKTESKVVEKKLEHIAVEIAQDEIPPNIFKKVDPIDEDIGPQNWSKIYNSIVKMRSKFLAPVDIQGCESMPNTITKNLKFTDPKKFRFQLLISLMLSSQTKDEVNFEAMNKLNNSLNKTHPNGFCIEAVSQLTEKEIDSFICKVGFHNRKAIYIKKSCEILNNQFNGDIPKTIEEIVTLPGVGHKMGYLLLQCGWNINSGIGIDVHLHRLSLLWHWVSSKAKTPEKCRLELESWLPRNYWSDINPLIVGFGQVICVPRAPNCDICDLGKNGLCKAADKKLVKQQPITEERRIKLMKQRADLTNLLNDLI